jgi:hypothetical protein
MVPTAQPRLMKCIASFLLASGPLWIPPPPPRSRPPHSHLYSSPRKFPVESHLLLGCSHKIPNRASVTSEISCRDITVPSMASGLPGMQHSGLQYHIRPLLTRSIKACTAPCSTWILRWVRAQRLVEFSQLRKHSSSSRRWHLSSTLGFTHTRQRNRKIIKQGSHGTLTGFPKKGLRPPIYSSGAQHRSPSILQTV